MDKAKVEECEGRLFELEHLVSLQLTAHVFTVGGGLQIKHTLS